MLMMRSTQKSHNGQMLKVVIFYICVVTLVVNFFYVNDGIWSAHGLGLLVALQQAVMRVQTSFAINHITLT